MMLNDFCRVYIFNKYEMHMKEKHETKMVPYNSLCRIFKQEFSKYVKISKVCTISLKRNVQ